MKKTTTSRKRVPGFNPSFEMSTLSEVMERLRKSGIENEFRMAEKGFTTGHEDFFQPADLKIVKFYRFEGLSNPSDASILYVIEGPDGLKGFNLDAYGTYSNELDEKYDEFIRRIPVEGKTEEELFEGDS